MEYKEFTGKNVEDAVTNALVELEITSDKLDYQVVDTGSAGFLGIGSKPAKILAKSVESVEDVAKDFLSKVLEAMHMSVNLSLETDEDGKALNIDMLGENMGALIGKRGQTLDSLQYLTSLVVNKNGDQYIRVKLDTENYRERRKATLESLAKNIAFKVKRTKNPVSLEPMNPYERRIIHSALQGDKYVTTRSEGEEPYRHVVVFLKK